jgi:hypothetical protein
MPSRLSRRALHSIVQLGHRRFIVDEPVSARPRGFVCFPNHQLKFVIARSAAIDPNFRVFRRSRFIMAHVRAAFAFR